MSGPSSAPFALLAAEAWEAIYKHWLLGANQCIRKHGKDWKLGKLFGPWPPFRSRNVAWTALTNAIHAEQLRRHAAHDTQNAGGTRR